MPKILTNTIQVHIAKHINNKSAYEFLVLQRSADKQPFPSVWQAITGNIERGESAIGAAIREVYEETNLVPSQMWFLPYVAAFYSPDDNTINNSPVFGMIVDDISNLKISKEHQAFKWLNYEDCYKIFQLPSHKEGLNIFKEYILENSQNKMYEIEILL